MKTQVQRYGLLVLLLVGVGVTWLKRDACTLEATAAWVQQLGTRGPFLFAGLYGLAPTLHLRSAVPSIPAGALCGTILGMALILMGTTIGVMGACLMVRSLMGVWCVTRVASPVSSVGAGATSVRPSV
jgi:uncharacterized membrane protein YdjX (TVP38/TMEM64 family)